MGKTYRKGIAKTHKSPKGRKRAIINLARKGAIPPDAWDDYNLNPECHLPMKIASRLYKRNIPEYKIRKTLKTKFNLQPWEINFILSFIIKTQKAKTGNT